MGNKTGFGHRECVGIGKAWEWEKYGGVHSKGIGMTKTQEWEKHNWETERDVRIR